MNRLHTLLTAGGVTGLVLATVLALGLAPDRQVSATGVLSPTATSTMTTAGQAVLPEEGNSATVDALVEQNRQLKEALVLMQRREAQYEAQIEQANQILAQMARAAAPSADREAYAYADHDDYDDDEHDDDEHDDDHDEHEDSEHEHDDYDDDDYDDDEDDEHED